MIGGQGDSVHRAAAPVPVEFQSAELERSDDSEASSLDPTEVAHGEERGCLRSGRPQWEVSQTVREQGRRRLVQRSSPISTADVVSPVGAHQVHRLWLCRPHCISGGRRSQIDLEHLLGPGEWPAHQGPDSATEWASSMVRSPEEVPAPPDEQGRTPCAAARRSTSTARSIGHRLSSSASGPHAGLLDGDPGGDGRRVANSDSSRLDASSSSGIARRSTEHLEQTLDQPPHQYQTALRIQRELTDPNPTRSITSAITGYSHAGTQAPCPRATPPTRRPPAGGAQRTGALHPPSTRRSPCRVRASGASGRRATAGGW